MTTLKSIASAHLQQHNQGPTPMATYQELGHSKQRSATVTNGHHCTWATRHAKHNMQHTPSTPC